jgi:hypothetical protein
MKQKRFGRKQPSRFRHKMIIMSENKFLRCWICGSEIMIRFTAIKYGIATQGLAICPDCIGEMSYVPVCYNA